MLETKKYTPFSNTLGNTLVDLHGHIQLFFSKCRTVIKLELQTLEFLELD